MDPLTAFPDADELEAAAREVLEHADFDRIAGSADDEWSAQANRRAFDRYSLRPRMLAGVESVDTSVELLGTTFPSPVLVAPMGRHAMVHEQGELATARSAEAAGVGFIASSSSSYSMEEIAEVAGHARWFQLYCLTDRDATKDLIARAAQAGYRALCLTADVQRVALRRRDVRNAFAHREDVRRSNLEAYGLADFGPLTPGGPPGNHHPMLSWEDLEWIRAASDLPVLIKGILTGEDTARAISAGVDGIVVSNHGGRSLGRAPATLDVLPEIARAAHGRATVIHDGGVRKPSDAIVALSLGADAVTIGRPVLWSLAAGGPGLQERFLRDFSEGIARILALMGRSSVAELDATAVRRDPLAGPF